MTTSNLVSDDCLVAFKTNVALKKPSSPRLDQFYLSPSVNIKMAASASAIIAL